MRVSPQQKGSRKECHKKGLFFALLSMMIMVKRYMILLRKHRAEDTKYVREDQICESLYFPREI